MTGPLDEKDDNEMVDDDNDVQITFVNENDIPLINYMTPISVR